MLQRQSRWKTGSWKRSHVFSLSSKSSFSVSGFGWGFCDHKTHSGGQEAISAPFLCPVVNNRCLGWRDFSWFCSSPFLLLTLHARASSSDCKARAMPPVCFHYLLIPDSKRVHCFTAILHSGLCLDSLIIILRDNVRGAWKMWGKTQWTTYQSVSTSL